MHIRVSNILFLLYKVAYKVGQKQVYSVQCVSVQRLKLKIDFAAESLFLLIHALPFTLPPALSHAPVKQETFIIIKMSRNFVVEKDELLSEKSVPTRHWHSSRHMNYSSEKRNDLNFKINIRAYSGVSVSVILPLLSSSSPKRRRQKEKGPHCNSVRLTNIAFVLSYFVKYHLKVEDAFCKKNIRPLRVVFDARSTYLFTSTHPIITCHFDESAGESRLEM